MEREFKTTGSGIKANRFGTHMEKYSEIRQENNMSKESEATEELRRWTGLKHFEHMTHTVPLSWKQMFNKRERMFLQQLMGVPIPQL